MNEMIIPVIIGLLLGVVVGFIVAKIIAKNSASSIIGSAEKEAKILLKESKKEGEALKKNSTCRRM
jgi:ribonuclease Y